MMTIFIEELTKISLKKITIYFFCAKYFIGREIKWKMSKISMKKKKKIKKREREIEREK